MVESPTLSLKGRATRAGHPAYLWEYNGAMKIVNFPTQGYNMIGASGECPHCGVNSYMRPHHAVTEQMYRLDGGVAGFKMASPAQCESCKEFVLVVGTHGPQQGIAFNMLAVYPLGKPNDKVDGNVPKVIAEDFSEALRCEWIQSYKGCVTMCRRAVQASALELGANPKEKLVAQIDELFTKGKITEPLRDFAHVVRLTGNDGAHPDKDGLDNVTPQDAKDMIAFTTEYLHHVYVMPAKLKARKAASAPPPGSSTGS